MPADQQQASGPSKLVIILVGIIMLLMALCVYYVVPLPGLTHADLAVKKSKLEADLKEKGDKLNTLRTTSTPEKLEELREELERVEALLKEYEGKLPSEEQIPQLLYELQRIARSNGIVFQVIRKEDKESEEGYVKVPFKMEISADYFQSMDLFHMLEYGERIGTVEGFMLQPASASKGSRDRGAPVDAPVGYVPKMNVKTDIAIYALQKAS